MGLSARVRTQQVVLIFALSCRKEFPIRKKIARFATSLQKGVQPRNLMRPDAS